MSTIYSKLLQAQTKLEAPKSSYNSFGNFKYRNCEGILEALKPILSEIKATLVITDSVEHVGDRYYIKSTVKFIDIESGEHIENSALAREEEDRKSYDSSQLTGSASSYARKYALNGLFCINDAKHSSSKDRGEYKEGNNTKSKETNYTNEKPKEANTKEVKSTDEFIHPTKEDISKMYNIGYKCGYTYPKVDELVRDRFHKKVDELTNEEYEYILCGFNKLIKNKKVGA